MRIYPHPFAFVLAFAAPMPYIMPATPPLGAAMSAALDPSLAADAAPAPFAEALVRAEHDKGRTVLTRAGRPVAVLVPIEDMAALDAFEDEQDSRLAEEAIARWEAAGRPLGCTHDDLMARYGIPPDAE